MTVGSEDFYDNLMKELFTTSDSEDRYVQPRPRNLRESCALAAIAEEARRRGTSYGKLVAHSTRAEIDAIVTAYIDRRQRRRRKSVADGETVQTYIVRDNRNGDLLIKGTAWECAQYIHVGEAYFRTTLVRQGVAGHNKQYLIRAVGADGREVIKPSAPPRPLNRYTVKNSRGEFVARGNAAECAAAMGWSTSKFYAYLQFLKYRKRGARKQLFYIEVDVDLTD